LGSASFGRGLVLLHHARRDPPAIADRNAVVFRPRTDVAAALPAGRGPGSPANQSSAGLAGMLDERRELLAEGAGVLAAQINLIIRALEAEPHSLVRWAAIQVVLQRDGYLLSHINLPCRRWVNRTMQRISNLIRVTSQIVRQFRRKAIHGGHRRHAERQLW